MPDLIQPTLPPAQVLEDSGFPDSLQLQRQAPRPSPPVLVIRPVPAPMSGVERLVWAVLVLLTLCPAVGFLLAWWMG